MHVYPLYHQQHHRHDMCNPGKYSRKKGKGNENDFLGINIIWLVKYNIQAHFRSHFLRCKTLMTRSHEGQYIWRFTGDAKDVFWWRRVPMSNV